jgi:hypothetical protein
MSKLFWFPPVSVLGTLKHDFSDVVSHSKVDTHPSGRLGISFDIPDDWADKNGVRLSLVNSDFFEWTARGVLDLNYFNYDPALKDIAGLLVDDCTLVKKPAPCPEVPVPPIPPIPVPVNHPELIIKAIYATGKYELVTKEGCGKFTEACCDELNKVHSKDWGYIKTSGAQNGYNGHRLDKIQLKASTFGVGATTSGVYDIIFNSENPNAEPAFNYQGPPILELWYYPA